MSRKKSPCIPVILGMNRVTSFNNTMAKKKGKLLNEQPPGMMNEDIDNTVGTSE